MGQLRFRILGCGSSGGVPRLGNQWGRCDPANPKNHRLRCSLLIERETEAGTTRVLVDTSPDLRAQLLAADVAALDGVVYTHSHADHCHGLDDLRMVVFNTRRRLTVWADGATQDNLLSRFAYAFVQPHGSDYPPILEMETIHGPFEIDGAGGPIALTPFHVAHGNIDSLGYRVGDLAYLPDVSAVPDEAWPVLQGLDCWILDALRRTPHPSHAHLERSLEWIDRAAPRRAILTNMHVDMDHEEVGRDTPEHVIPAHDGLTVTYEF